MTRFKSSFTKEQLIDAYEEHRTIAGVAKFYEVPYNVIQRKFKQFEIEHLSENRKFQCNHNFFSEDDEYSFYWAGYLAACGTICSNEKGYRIQLNTSIQEKHHLERFKNDLQSSALIKELRVTQNNYLTVRFLISSKQLVQDLENRFNVTPRKTFTYTIPNWVQNHEMVEHFIRGWVDGKGTFFIKNEKLIYFRTSGTIEFLNSLMTILHRKCGAEIKEIKPYKSRDGLPLGSVIYSRRSDIKAIGNYLYGNAKIYLERRQEVKLLSEGQI